MGIRDKVHAAILSRDGLERHPDAETGVVFGGIPIRFVLVPRGRGGIVWRFVDGVVTHHGRFGTEQLLHDRLEIADELGAEKFRGELSGLQKLRQHGGSGRVARASQILNIAARIGTSRIEQAIVDIADDWNLGCGHCGVDGNISMRVIEFDLLVGQLVRGLPRARRSVVDRLHVKWFGMIVHWVWGMGPLRSWAGVYQLCSAQF